MKKYFGDYLFLFGISGVIIALDQLTKTLVRANLQFSEFWSPWEWLEPYVRIVNWKNSGAAFGMMQGFGGIFSILSILVSLVIIYYFPQVSPKDWTLRLALSMQLGGAVGNLVDRILHDGFVTDFISVGNFPVFNIADASITVGVAILILGMWVKEQEEKKRAASILSENRVSETQTGEQDNMETMVNQFPSPGSYSGEKPSDG